MPLRTCIGCKEKKDKKMLMRFVCDGHGNILFDREQTMEGRGAYICCDMICIRKACEGKNLSHVFRRAIDPYTPEELWAKIKGLS